MQVRCDGSHLLVEQGHTARVQAAFHWQRVAARQEREPQQQHHRHCHVGVW
jgi:hypothetical protein